MKVSSITRRLMAQRRSAREARSARTAREYAPVMRKEERDGPIRVRRWEAADTTRLNKSHWQHAYGRTINEDLYERLEPLRIRCEHQVANDPILEGVLSTVSNDAIGPDGPRVQVQSEDEAYNRAVEEAIAEYFDWPDPTVGTRNSPVSIAETLKVDIRSLCTAGEFLHQYASAEAMGARREGPFDFAIRSPHPRRLETPYSFAGQQNFFMGLELASTSAVTRYHFRDEPPGIYARTTPNWKPVDVQNVQHLFLRHEQDQLRGFPWFAVSLDDMADRSMLNKFVMESAKNAAAQGVLWFTDHPEALMQMQFVDETHPLEPGMQQTGPPGYKPFMITPTQPGANWKEFDHEKLRGYGRPFGMPLMMILLSSEGNSFSGANHDGQIYIRSIAGLQSWLWKGCVRPQCRQVEQEVVIRKGLRRPRRVEMVASWPVPPHPDPKKNYEALRMQLEDGAIDLRSVCTALGRDFDSVQAARDYVNKVLERYDLPPAPINLGNAGGKPADLLRQVAAKIDEAENVNTEAEDDDEANRQNDRQAALAR